MWPATDKQNQKNQARCERRYPGHQTSVSLGPYFALQSYRYRTYSERSGSVLIGQSVFFRFEFYERDLGQSKAPNIVITFRYSRLSTANEANGVVDQNNEPFFHVGRTVWIVIHEELEIR